VQEREGVNQEQKKKKTQGSTFGGRLNVRRGRKWRLFVPDNLTKRKDTLHKKRRE